MWPFKKKVPIDAKFKKSDRVRFRLRGELSMGFVYNIYKNKENEIIYDIQIAGQCPAIIYGVHEEELKLIES